MNKQQKEALIVSLGKNFSQNEASFLVNVKGLTVAQSESLRKKLRVSGGRLQIVKVRLMKRALVNVEQAQVLKAFMKDQIGVVFTQESQAVAKVLSDFSKQINSFKIVAGVVDASLLHSHEVGVLAYLPARPVLMGHVVQAVQAPISGLVFVANQMLAQVVILLEQVVEKKQNS